MLGFFSFLSGFIFGMGLLISGMANPSKVIGFLDVAGNWDPSLAFVMIGAISISMLSFRYVKRTSSTIWGEIVQLPTAKKIDKKLIFGSLLFGIGWGLVGFCPGPAIVAIGTGNLKAIIFTISMIVAMLIYEWLQTALDLNR